MQLLWSKAVTPEDTVFAAISVWDIFLPSSWACSIFPLLLPALLPAQTLVQPSYESHGEMEPFKQSQTQTSKHTFAWLLFNPNWPQIWLGVQVLTPAPGWHKVRSDRINGASAEQRLVSSPEASANAVSFSFAKGSTKLSHDLKITRNTHIWGSVCLFVLVQSNGALNFALKKNV